MSQFKVFANAVRKQFEEMSGETLFVVGSTREDIWARYLGAFPAGTDPIYRVRTEHDCSCCRHFLYNCGNIVAIQNGARVSIWDIAGLPEPYQTVAAAMAAYVKSLPIVDAFIAPFAKYGTEGNLELIDGKTIRYDHFSLDLPKRFVSADHVARCGHIRTSADVLKRSLGEFTQEAVETVAELIASKSIYRGEEFKKGVQDFQKLQARYLALPAEQRADFIWTMAGDGISRFKTTVIGSLVEDLSKGVSLEDAVKMFESKVAPTNYKRPKALITPKMIEKALEDIRALGLEDALARRHARLTDVSVNNVLFVDNSVRGKMKDSLASLLMQEVKPAEFDKSKAQEIDVEEFTSKVLPGATGVQLYLENSHLGNFVSLTAPVHPDTGRLFKWSNDFAWSYDGNAANSVKEKVKRAGGRVENVAMRVSLAWSNSDDLDLHVITPSGNHIYFGNRCDMLDIDANAFNIMADPVENIRWIGQPRDGTYVVQVDNYRRRSSENVGFEVEVENCGSLWNLQSTTNIVSQSVVATFLVEKGRITRLDPGKHVKHGSSSQEKWGLKTSTLVPVDSVVVSPNHWDKPVGNKHLFFLLKDCKNPDPVRGIYNEFLSPELEKHRKVLEVLGDKTKCPVADEQLSGVGFSAGRENKATVMVTSKKASRPYTILF